MGVAAVWGCGRGPELCGCCSADGRAGEPDGGRAGQPYWRAAAGRVRSGRRVCAELVRAKGELARLSDELVRGLGQRLRGLDRFTRSERLAAAHSVVALSAYFDVLAVAELPFDARELELTRPSRRRWQGGRRDRTGWVLAAGLLRAEVPMPAPQRPYEATLDAMRGFYRPVGSLVAVRVGAGGIGPA